MTQSRRPAPPNDSSGPWRAGRSESRQAVVEAENRQDDEFGFPLFESGPTRLGWMLNMHQTSVFDRDSRSEQSAVNFYFMQDDGTGFRVTVVVPPYFLIRVKPERRLEVEQYLMKKFEGQVLAIEVVEMEDLGLPNHLSGLKGVFLKLSFANTQAHAGVRKVLHPIINRNRANLSTSEVYDDEDRDGMGVPHPVSRSECLSAIVDIREYDVPYTQAVCIAHQYFAGLWYRVSVSAGNATIERDTEIVEVPDLRILAYDIETTKAPLKFPDPSVDSIMMISYMVDGDGFLIVNREIVAEDIEDFEYTPKPDYPGPFTVFNESNERALLERFVSHIQELRPHIVTTYNGDFFDFKFVDARMAVYGWSMQKRIGIGLKESGDEYGGRFCVHLDAFCWVRRDSYLPQGSQGLKAVTKAKLAYNPVELDPEDMVAFATSQPQLLASYSVSDAVATYYLYCKYVHLFVYSLCTIIPLGPDDVLRKGSGTLCEMLLMVEASRANIVCPNKDREDLIQFHDGHLLESQTYIGGHVECLEAGVFRDDLPEKFVMSVEELDNLIATADDAIRFAVEKEKRITIDQVTNAEEVREQIVAQLETLRSCPTVTTCPKIYHLDVQAMYPNLILTNRLQPMAIVDSRTCAACDFNIDSDVCQRHMEWAWKGRFYPAKRREIEQIRANLNESLFPKNADGGENGPTVRYQDLSLTKQAELLVSRVKAYSTKVYKKQYEESIETRSATICQRENPFYVNTVLNFRDRRYKYKALNKTWKEKAKNGKTLAEKQKANSMVLLYDSMQLAHKCILNSFYGYVMRRGARWHSMEMAGVVTLTGANIIKETRHLIERIGRPLELDTDGIWCILPSGFPDKFQIKFLDKGQEKSFEMTYPCTILNRIVHRIFTNDQYLTLEDQESHTYRRSTKNDIFFEVDGPYKAMVIPAAPEEGKMLKKRYAVFNFDGSLAELKGFEIKRRGELSVIKVFQSQVFPAFLEGSTLKECYAAVGTVANRWLDVLERKGADLTDEEVFELLSETKSMSQSISAYGNQKSTAIMTARRLASFLGADLLNDKLSCQFIISRNPQGAPVSERAIPVKIFGAEEGIRQTYLRKWLGDSSLKSFDIRSILDWSYYSTRLGSAIQKIITIPAAAQHISNPVPRVMHPEWLTKRVATESSAFKQSSIASFLRPVTDIEQAVPQLQDTRTERASPPARPEHAPRMLDDFQAFLSFEKKRWRELRAERSVARNPASPNRRSGASRASAVRRLHKQPDFQIVQIYDPKDGGPLVFWVYDDGRDEFRSFRVRVPRKVIVNSKVNSCPIPHAHLLTSTRVLPRGRLARYLFELVNPSDDEVAALRASDQIDGVFESQVPLSFTAIVAVGNVVRSAGRADLFRGGPCDLHDLECGPQSQSRVYLDKIDAMARLFLYASGNLDRSVIALCASNPSEGGATAIFVVVVSAKGTPGERPDLQAIAADIVHREELGPGIDVPNIDAEYKVVRSFDAAVNLLRDRLHKVAKQHSPTMLVTQISASLEQCLGRSKINQLSHALSLPIVEIPTNINDDRYRALQWLPAACRTLTARFLSVRSIVSQIASFSRYGLVPIGNISSNMSSFIMDVFFARLLRSQDHVWWCSSTDRPDLGFDKRCTDDDSFFFQEPLSNPVKVSPGCYRDACIEIEILNMAANALLSSDCICLIEGTISDPEPAPEDRTAHRLLRYRDRPADCRTSSQAFAVLQQLTVNLFEEIRKNKNDLADMLICQIYQWISSPSSLFYEPNVHRMLHDLMRKVFLRLCADFRSLGAQVVYGSFTKLVLHARKPTLPHAMAFIRSAAASVQENDLFRMLIFRFDRVWLSLLYMDAANYAGVPAAPDQGDDRDETEPIAEAHWNVAEYLPELPRDRFLELTTEFLVRPYLYWRSGNPEDCDESNRVAYLRDQALSYYLRRLLGMVDEVIEVAHGPRHSDDDRARASAFPDGLPGAHLSSRWRNPALEFAKMCIHVLSLDASIAAEVDTIRSTAMRLLRVSPFSDESRWVNPCRTYVLMDVVCSFCRHVRDVDLCREVDGTNRDVRCPMCQNVLDMDAIEAALLKVVRWMSDSYQVQDLVCGKCGSVARTNMSATCTCSGSLRARTDIAQYRRQLAVFDRIARHYQLPWLAQTCDFLAQ
ncbi:unnamed protein product (mitochondrion) [Plasmodiophora brassicae]|uniref:DNA polymerase epsilon catalytic subunit n=1 Tax=Plasmodiophora brassicae TaxID=37360 RepID=A0A3P3YHR4_PLABS|nr:unnamed protein product [Plasmodiophora brassicae]